MFFVPLFARVRHISDTG